MPQLNKRSFRHNQQPAQTPSNSSSSLPQQSSSVPSTPMRSSRDRKRRIQSPSPGHGNPSPQSIASDVPETHQFISRSHFACRFESNACLGRRRIPYNIGDDPLPRLENVKDSLSEEEDRKLGAAAEALYKKLLPSPESEERRRQFSSKLMRLLETKWPNYRFVVHVFGSSGNLLCTSDSDVDICIETNFKELETMHTLAELLAANGMEKVVCVSSAKVPIVKIWDPVLQLSCDMNVNNTLALENTRMVRTYVQLDPRVRPLAMIVKYWTKQRILNDAAIGGTFSSYTWICMIINFLQTREPPVLPALHQLDHKEKISSEGIDTAFADDVASLKGKSRNTESLAQLLFAFFYRYGHEFDYDQSVISVRHGRVLSREEKGWQITSKEGQWKLCVEEPFSISRNLGNSADNTAFRGIHLELRRAYDFLAVGDLDSFCEEFVWPQRPDEKHSANSSIFQKPNSSQSKPVLLSQPPTRGNRLNGNSTSNRTRHNSGPKPPPPFRRMSNSSQYGAGFANQTFTPGGPLLNYVHSPDGNIILLSSGDAAMRTNSFLPLSLTPNARFPFLLSAPHHQYGFVPYSAAALSASSLANWATTPTAPVQSQPQTQPSHSQIHHKPAFHNPIPINSALSNLGHRASTGALSPPKPSLLRTPLSSTVPATSCLFEDSATSVHDSPYSFVAPLPPSTQSRPDSDTSSPMSDQENVHRSSVSDVSSEWTTSQPQPLASFSDIVTESAVSAQIPVPNATAKNVAYSYSGRQDHRAGSNGVLNGSSPNSYPAWALSPDSNTPLRQNYPHLEIPALSQFVDSQSKRGKHMDSGLRISEVSKRSSRSLSPSKLLDDTTLSPGHFSALGRSPTEVTHDGSILIANGSHMLTSKSPSVETPESSLNFWNYGYGYDWVQGQDGIVYQIARPIDGVQFSEQSYNNQEGLESNWPDSDATQFHLETVSSRETPFGTDSDTSGETIHPPSSQWASQLSDSFARTSLNDYAAPSDFAINSQGLSPTQERIPSSSPATRQTGLKQDKSRSHKSQVNGHGSLKGQHRGEETSMEAKHARHADKPGKSHAHPEITGTGARHSTRPRRGSNPVSKGKSMEQWQWQSVTARGKRNHEANEDKLLPIPLNIAERKGG